MGQREEIANALRGVAFTWSGGPAELAPSPLRPYTLALWQAFPDWQSVRWLTRCIPENTWNVYVLLPTDPEAFTSATDALLEPVRDALSALGLVQQASPIALVASEQAVTMPALNFQLII